jgi:competence protein ComEC
MPFYDREIELVVLTHPGDERLGGLVGLPERYNIGQVLLRSAPQAAGWSGQAPFPYPSASYESWLRALQAQEVPITPAEAGTRVDLGYGITLDVLHPGPEPMLEDVGELDLKANSLVLRLSYGETSFLLTGDVPTDVQQQLVESGIDLESTVVKLPDGGRQASFSEAFLTATEAYHAVVFAQREDRFRDLSAAVEEAWLAVVGDAGLYRTDLAGTVSFASDGRMLAQAN